MALFSRVIIVSLCAISLLGDELVTASECSGKPSPKAAQNLNPTFHGDPMFIKQVKNGKLYIVGEGDDAFYIAHVWGSPYEMGYAHGALLQGKAVQFIDAVWTYLEQQVISPINDTVRIFKPWFLKDVADFGLDRALDLELDATREFTDKHFFEEAQGLADSTGLAYMKIMRIHMIGELTKGHCSMFGAWGDAVKDRGSFLQLRALDWNTDGPFKDFPQVTVYHPDPSAGHAFANIGWTGWLGSITGFNSRRVSISEIGVSFPDSTFGSESRFGVPFTYFLRDILQFADSVPRAMKMMTEAKRTCDLILGVGHAWANSSDDMFRGVQYSAAHARFYTDTDMQPVADWHPRIKNIVYYGMDWLCPGFSEVLARQLKTNYGELSADVVIRDVVSIEQSGSLHIAIYDFNNDFVYIANARGSLETGPLDAYDRPFVRLNATSLFAVTRPAV